MMLKQWALRCHRVWSLLILRHSRVVHSRVFSAPVFCLLQSESVGPFARMVYILNSYCVAVWGRFWFCFQLFSTSDCPFTSDRLFLFSALGGATISRSCKKSKNRRKGLCAILCIDCWEILWWNRPMISPQVSLITIHIHTLTFTQQPRIQQYYVPK